MAAASTVPAGLKTADISRFAIRAGQLEKVKPIVAYWCNYWIVHQILSKELHNTDEECLTYTTTLMDRLEKFKAENADEAAVVDDVAGKAYIEQFGLETFERADNAVRANKASRQTADTFQASSTFLDLLAIWGPIEPEIKTKVKYAKLHAVRIAKAIKAGEDPNLSNPAPTPEAAPALEPANEGEAAVELNADTSTTTTTTTTTTPTTNSSVVEVADDSDTKQRALSRVSTLDQSLHPSRDASVAPAPPSQLPSQLPSQDILPQEADTLPDAPANMAFNNDTLPTIPKAGIDSSYLPPPSAPSVELPPPPTVPSIISLTPPPAQITHQPPPPPPPPPVAGAGAGAGAASSVPYYITPQVPQPVAAPAVEVDEEAMSRAQKHARWAISALNFEDVPTAIKELRAALADLGG